MLNQNQVQFQPFQLYKFYPNASYPVVDFTHPKRGWDMSRMVYTSAEGIHMEVEVVLDENKAPKYLDTLRIDNTHFFPICIALQRPVQAFPDLIRFKKTAAEGDTLLTYQVDFE